MKPIHSGRVIAGKYRLEVCRARGGMGSVWQARHLLLDIPLAIKFIDPHLASSAEARGRFEREAKTVARLRGTHVAQIHDYGVEDEIPYMAMELLAGEDLAARLTRVRRLSLPAAVNIVTNVAKVLRRAHAAGVIHRDLKPGNIFLVPGDDGEEIVKVLDFGVAKNTLRLEPHADHTKTGTLVGSPRYMSPEQARGIKDLDHRADLWSLGVIAFRMVTGELPFPGDQIGDVILKICTERAPVPSRLAPELPRELDGFFNRALARDPDARFQSAAEMARAFAIAAGQSPPCSTDPPAPDSFLESSLASLARSRAAHGEPAPRLSENPTRVDRPPPPVERTHSSPAAPDPETTAASAIDRPDSRTAHILPSREPAIPLGARLGWGAAGAALASLVLGGALLISRPGGVPEASRALQAAAPLLEVPAPAHPELAPVQAALALPSSSAEEAVPAAPPAPSARSPAARPRTPPPRAPHPARKNPLGL